MSWTYRAKRDTVLYIITAVIILIVIDSVSAANPRYKFGSNGHLEYGKSTRFDFSDIGGHLEYETESSAGYCNPLTQEFNEDGTILENCNSGTIERLTLLNKSSGYIQAANNNSARFGWATYEYGLMIDSFGTWTFKGIDQLENPNTYETTDNLTFWAAESYGTEPLGLGGVIATYHLTNYQEAYDDYVDMVITINTSKKFQFFVADYLAVAITNINIENDNDENDIVNFVANDTLITHNLSRDGDLLTGNVGSYLLIGDKDISKGIRYVFNDEEIPDLIYILNKTIYILREVDGQLFIDDFGFQWIDIDLCLVSCDLGFSMNLLTNETYTGIYNYNQYDTYEIFGKLSVAGLGSGNCYTNNKCAMRFVLDDSPTGRPAARYFNTTPEEDYTKGWNCVEGPCYWDVIDSELPYTMSVTAQAINPNVSRVRFYLTERSNASKRHGDVNLYTGILRRYVDEALNLNVTLLSPEDEAVINKSWEEFTCYTNESIDEYDNPASQYYYVRTVDFYINDSLNTTYYSDPEERDTWYGNFTVNISGFSEEGIYEWDCKAAINDHLNWSTNGNYTFTWEELIIITPVTPSTFNPAKYIYLYQETDQSKSLLQRIIRTFLR